MTNRQQMLFLIKKCKERWPNTYEKGIYNTMKNFRLMPLYMEYLQSEDKMEETFEPKLLSKRVLENDVSAYEFSIGEDRFTVHAGELEEAKKICKAKYEAYATRMLNEITPLEDYKLKMHILSIVMSHNGLTLYNIGIGEEVYHIHAHDYREAEIKCKEEHKARMAKVLGDEMSIPRKTKMKQMLESDVNILVEKHLKLELRDNIKAHFENSSNSKLGKEGLDALSSLYLANEVMLIVNQYMEVSKEKIKEEMNQIFKK